MFSVGIMQGRLLPPFEGRFQAFPARNWEAEFPIARDAGIVCIEWIYEVPHEADNPLATRTGRATMGRLFETTGVNVWSVCADHYMSDRLIAPSGERSERAVGHLRDLITWSGDLGVTYVVLPFVDSSALNSPPEWEALVALMADLAPAAERHGVELHLETSLPPRLFVRLLERIDSPWIRANYDTGNSAAMGFDPGDELSRLGQYIGSVHIKDRVLGGGTVALGTGDCDFPACFRELRRAGFDRWFILQAARGEDGREAELARRNIEFVREGWNAAKVEGSS